MTLLLDRLNRFDELFDEQIQDYNITHNDKETLIDVELPRVKKKDIELAADLEYLNLKAKYTKYGQEFSYVKRFYIGNKFDINRISSKLEDGVLNIILPLKDTKDNLRLIQIE